LFIELLSTEDEDDKTEDAMLIAYIVTPRDGPDARGVAQSVT
jgi:hypothetical protein